MMIHRSVLFYKGLKKIAFGVLLFMVQPGAHAQTKSGVLIDSVECLESPDTTYALYLPSDYTDSLSWPVVYVLEPAARGSLGVKVFQEAAEKYGYIIVCSNDSRNGPFIENYKIVEVVSTDVDRRYSIDSQRIYFSGFSGGSRTALSIAVLNKSVAGVIGCGAALPTNVELYPTAENRFSYLGLVGVRDMNYLEMIDLEMYLNKVGVSNNLRFFEEGHLWPPPEQMVGAIEYMQLQAMKQSRIPFDTLFIDKIYQKRMTQADRYVAESKWYDAAHWLENVMREFQGLHLLSKVKENYSEIIDAKGYKKEVKNRERWLGIEKDYQSQFIAAANQLVAEYPVDPNLKYWWNIELRKLNRKVLNDHNYEHVMALRLKNLLSAMSIEWSDSYIQRKNYNTAYELIQIGLQLNPQIPYYWFIDAKIETLRSNNDNAIEALQKALDRGLDPDWLKSNAFDTLRNTPQFINLHPF